MMERLNARALGALPADVARPALRPRTRSRPAIVHLGVVRFQRAHQAMYTEAALAAGDSAGASSAASLRSPAVRDPAQAAGQSLYAQRSRRRGERLQVIGAIKGDAGRARGSARRCCSACAIRRAKIVALTVTEKATATIRPPPRSTQATPISARPGKPTQPRTAPGFLVEALRRTARGRCPFLHGAVLRQPSAQRPHGRGNRGALRRAARPGSLPATSATRSRFPRRWSTGITPATTDEDRAAIARAARRRGRGAGRHRAVQPMGDRGPLSGRAPGLVARGAEFVTDCRAIREHEAAAARTAAHSTLAYLGYSPATRPCPTR
jgi:fructuronate reductase